MGVEILFYIVIAAVLFTYRTVLSGRKNGCFYHKNDNPLPPMLEREIKNIHFIESPAWYVQTGGVFLLTFAINRGLNTDITWINLLVQFVLASLITYGSVQAASYHYQRGITAGLKDDDHLDAISETEVAIALFGKKILQYWKNRLFNNRGRILSQWLGISQIIIGLTLMYLYYNYWYI